MSGVPAVLYGQPEAIVLYRNLPCGPAERRDEQEQRAALALRIDQAMREKAPSRLEGRSRQGSTGAQCALPDHEAGS